MQEIPRPDLSDRPLQMTCERTIGASPADVLAAWTENFDSWFAQPGTLVITAEPGQPYFFYTPDEWGRHPHYGRILELKKNRLVEMTWMTGNGAQEGTEGAETILRVELTPDGDEATLVKLVHSGFVSRDSLEGHARNWPLALDLLDESLSGGAGPAK